MTTYAHDALPLGKTVYDLTGKVAVITGAGGGIGRATGQLLASVGAAVVCADVSEPQVTETVRLIEAAGGTATACVTNVTRYDQVEAMVDSAANAYGRLDVLANIAGIIINQTVEQTIEDDFDRVMAVNVKGVLFGCKAAIKVMKPQRSGSIINISSQAIDHPVPDTVAYSMSKAAVAQLTRNLAVELGPHGVRVNAIAPGLVVSPMTRRHFTDPDGSVDEARKAAFVGRLAQLSPLGRVGAPEDIAHAILYLASEASRYMTGQILRPNGGSSMPW